MTYPQTSKVYCSRTMLYYFTDIKSKRQSSSYSSSDFDKFAKSKNKLNQPYGESFISGFCIGDDDYFIEHNEQLNVNDIISLSQIVTQLHKNATANETD